MFLKICKFKKNILYLTQNAICKLISSYRSQESLSYKDIYEYN